MKIGATLLFLCVLAASALAHATGPPKCPYGSAPSRDEHGWKSADGGCVLQNVH